jgi:hypothetical protein
MDERGQRLRQDAREKGKGRFLCANSPARDGVVGNKNEPIEISNVFRPIRTSAGL